MDFSYYTVYWLPGRLVPGKIYYEKGIEGIKGSRFNRILQRETGFCEERSDEAISQAKPEC